MPWAAVHARSAWAGRLLPWPTTPRPPPGTLAGLPNSNGPEISIVHSWKWFSEDFNTTPYVTPDKEFALSTKDLNYLSIVYPFKKTLAGRNMVLSLNLQHKYDFARELQFTRPPALHQHARQRRLPPERKPVRPSRPRSASS